MQWLRYCSDLGQTLLSLVDGPPCCQSLPGFCAWPPGFQSWRPCPKVLWQPRSRCRLKIGRRASRAIVVLQRSRAEKEQLAKLRDIHEAQSRRYCAIIVYLRNYGMPSQHPFTSHVHLLHSDSHFTLTSSYIYLCRAEQLQKFAFSAGAQIISVVVSLLWPTLIRLSSYWNSKNCSSHCCESQNFRWTSQIHNGAIKSQ